MPAKFSRGAVVSMKVDRVSRVAVRVVGVERDDDRWLYSVVFANGGNAEMVAYESNLR